MRNLRGRLIPLATLLLLCGIGVFTWGCESGTESNVGSYSVTYLFEGQYLQDGSALVSTVYYDDADGTQTVDLDPPQSGWSTTVNLVPGDTIYLRVEGTVVSGRFRLQAQVFGDDGSFFARTADGMPYDTGDVYVEIPREALP